jgi:ribose 5-phosphate isomerase B
LFASDNKFLLLAKTKINRRKEGETMLVVLGSDHGGFELKNKLVEYLESKKISWIDLGAHKYVKTDDYPDIALKVSRFVIKKKAIGILVCWAGVGMSIAANKVKGIRAAAINNTTSARYSRRDNDANIICLPGTIKPELAKKLVDIFLKEKFDGGRHLRRVNKIKKIERIACK